ncbi:hypothetical protein BU15DRAFT_78632 [Melanogaster broomeanus]|nr:hypothetical protein BU15DRAFT_78632 [Melanogaster broomeanus]
MPRRNQNQDTVNFIDETAYQIVKCMQLGEQHAAVVRVDPARYERAAQIAKRTRIPLEDLCAKGASTDVEHLTIALAAHDRLVAHSDALASIDDRIMKRIDLKIVELMKNWTERYVDQLPLPPPPSQPTFRPLVASTVPALPQLTRPAGRLELGRISDEDVHAFIIKPQRIVTVGDCFVLKDHDEHNFTLYRVMSCNLVASELVFGIQFEGTVDAVDVGQTEMTNLLRASSRALNV